MSEWRDAEVVSLPVPEGLLHEPETEFDRTGLWLTLGRDGRRQRTPVLQYRALPDGRRAVLAIVDRPVPSVRTAWVVWDADHMSLEYTAEAVLATAEARPRAGDARRVRAGGMPDPVTGHTPYWPPRPIEVRVGGLWRPGGLRCLFHGPDGPAVAQVSTSLYEPDWGAWVAYRRMYHWDPETLRPAATGRPVGAGLRRTREEGRQPAPTKITSSSHTTGAVGSSESRRSMMPP
ncbi:hypothetical protein AB0C59_21840 [Streptomyces sp. NPDC048664]|uniref:hypothetical protein n=1 Tax=Streptomyces sp. NPDC048664 TaxID=3154505 RepID=UPI003449B417